VCRYRQVGLVAASNGPCDQHFLRAPALVRLPPRREISPSFRPRSRSQVWAAEPDEKEKYHFTMEQINKFPEADRKRFFNFAYEVAEGVWSSECSASPPPLPPPPPFPFSHTPPRRPPLPPPAQASPRAVTSTKARC
jgi:hypothetical protein